MKLTYMIGRRPESADTTEQQLNGEMATFHAIVVIRANSQEEALDLYNKHHPAGKGKGCIMGLGDSFAVFPLIPELKDGKLRFVTGCLPEGTDVDKVMAVRQDGKLYLTPKEVFNAE